MEIFFDLIFRPRRAMKKSNIYSLITLLFIVGVFIPFHLQFSKRLSSLTGYEILGVKAFIIFVMIVIFYVFGTAGIYFILLTFDEKFRYSLILSYFPYVFTPISLFFGNMGSCFFLVLIGWSFYLEYLAVKLNTKADMTKSLMTMLIFKSLRVISILWLIFLW
ncbi:hypothetical protein [Kosmotoga olearia]|jgi:hypothetical protein|uniref:Yip1 domain-containing protein n=2 Tax=Kosmotoga TaxID=651456 RepID=C5CDU5_KOSOT|nr:hypothetical protein [Kosmotoga olearia]ACR79114.1 hypothetical protein Kole_0389 [Kosmotoga olearia TBF 19.5.1]MDI3523594.1 hypothetical protein [Kosmotoga sp.]MDK2953158.1 hypothetical protein [Kosmotoga sp.]